MFIVISFMVAGVAVGYLFRRYKFTFIHQLILLLIWLLLFMLGLELGYEKSIVANIMSLGVDALILAIAATLGSVFLHLYFGKAQKDRIIHLLIIYY